MKENEIIKKVGNYDKNLSFELKHIFKDLKKEIPNIKFELAGSRSRDLYFDIGNYRKFKSDFDIYIVIQTKNHVIEYLVNLRKKIRQIIQKRASNFKEFPGMTKIRSYTLGIDLPFIFEVDNQRFVINNLSGEVQMSNAIYIEKEVTHFVKHMEYGYDLLRIIRSFRGLLRINEKRYPKGIVLDLIIIKNYSIGENLRETIINTMTKIADFLSNMKNFDLNFGNQKIVLNYEKKYFDLFIRKINLFIEMIGD